MRKCALVVFVIMLHCLVGRAATVHVDVFINRGLMQTVSGTTFPVLSYNDSVLFSGINATLQINSGDSLSLNVHNTDTAFHDFAIKGFPGLLTIAPSDSVQHTWYFPQDGAFIYYDPSDAPSNRYMGLAGQILVLSAATSFNYSWNLKEHQSSYNNAIALGNAVDWSVYDPDFFTVNGVSYPDIQNDSLATVDVSLGQPYRIYISNTGQSKHSIHIHGFHGTVIRSSAGNIQVNASKDTFPIKSMESVVIEITPDKLGRYSVHDHNLVAVSGGGVHPNGMFTIMNIH